MSSSPRIFKRSVEDWTDSQFSVRLQFAGERRVVALGTAVEKDALKLARQMREAGRLGGWPAVVALVPQSGSKRARPRVGAVTIGDYLDAVVPLLTVAPTTRQEYVTALLFVVSRALGLDVSGHRSPKGTRAYRDFLERCQSVELARMAPAQIAAWNASLSQGAASDLDLNRLQQSRARVLRNAAALFSRQRVRLVRQVIPELPELLPFDDGIFVKARQLPYESDFDVKEIVQRAQGELMAARLPGERAEDARFRQWQFLAFTLAFFSGLRRMEIDRLTWAQLEIDDLDGGFVRIQSTEHMRLKRLTAARRVPIDPEVVAVLRSFREDASLSDRDAVFVLPGTRAVSQKARYRQYRAFQLFRSLIAWLRSVGVDKQKPIHALRSEIGNYIRETKSIFDASVFLGHTNVLVTQAHYVKREASGSSGAGRLLG